MGCGASASSKKHEEKQEEAPEFRSVKSMPMPEDKNAPAEKPEHAKAYEKEPAEGNNEPAQTNGAGLDRPETKNAPAEEQEVAVDDVPIDLQFNGEESDLDHVVDKLRLFNAKQLRGIFSEADADGSGFLQLAEVRKLFFPDAPTGDTETSLCVAKIFAQMDKNSDGKVRCGEFVAYVLQSKKALSSVATDSDKKSIVEAFNKADSDHSGAISLAEFQELMAPETEEERKMLQSAFETVDQNNDGQLSIVEFSRIYGKELLVEAKGPEFQWIEVEDDEESCDEKVEQMPAP